MTQILHKPKIIFAVSHTLMILLANLAMLYAWINQIMLDGQLLIYLT
jgi:hypothetical protein